jgi:hypothetical protein
MMQTMMQMTSDGGVHDTYTYMDLHINLPATLGENGHPPQLQLLEPRL